MLEVLVAILVLSLGLLGLGGLQATGLRNNYSAYLRAQAAQFAFDMTDRMRANRQVAIAGQYNLDIGDNAPTGGSLPDRDRAEWLALLGNLPSGDGAIAVAADGSTTVTIRWDDRRAGGNANETLTVDTRI